MRKQRTKTQVKQKKKKKKNNKTKQKEKLQDNTHPLSPLPNQIFKAKKIPWPSWNLETLT